MINTVAVGVDGSKTAAKALETAVEIARRFDARIVLLSALEDSRATSAGRAVDTVELEWAANPSARVRWTLETTEALTVLAVVYLALVWSLSALIRLLEGRLALPGTAR